MSRPESEIACFSGPHCSLYEVCGQLVELSSCECHVQVLRTCSVCGDIRDIYVYGCGVGERDLCLLSLVLQSLHRELIIAEVDSVGLLELALEVINYSLVEVVAAEVVVAGGRENLLNAVADLDYGYIERTAAEVVYNDLLLFFLINAVSERCRCRLVDDSVYLQTCDLTCVLGSLALAVGEVCRYSYNCVIDPSRRDMLLRRPSASEGSSRRSPEECTSYRRCQPCNRCPCVS